MKGFNKPTDNLAPEEQKIAELLLKYPTLEKVFDENQLENLHETKTRLQGTITDLERTVRTGSKEEAEKAARIIEACHTTLSFLAELESMRRN